MAICIDLLSMWIGASIPKETLDRLATIEPDTSTEFQRKTGMADDDGS